MWRPMLGSPHRVHRGDDESANLGSLACFEAAHVFKCLACAPPRSWDGDLPQETSLLFSETRASSGGSAFLNRQPRPRPCSSSAATELFTGTCVRWSI